MGDDLISIDILYPWVILNLLTLHVIACFYGSDMHTYCSSIAWSCTTKQLSRVSRLDLRILMAILKFIGYIYIFLG